MANWDDIKTEWETTKITLAALATITAVHNHWLFDNPRLMYMHWEDVGDPVAFAEDSYNAAREAGLLK